MISCVASAGRSAGACRAKVSMRAPKFLRRRARARSISPRSAAPSGASGAGSLSRRSPPRSISFVAVNLVTPRYKSETRILIESRETAYSRPDGERLVDRDRTPDRRAGGAEPGAARAVARSRAQGRARSQACGAVRIRAGNWMVVVLRTAVVRRARPRSVAHVGRGARARALLRAAERLSDRKIARHRRRVPVAGSRSRRRRRQQDRRGISLAPAAGQARRHALGGPVARKRDRPHARQGRRGRGAGRGVPRALQPVRRPRTTTR